MVTPEGVPRAGCLFRVHRRLFLEAEERRDAAGGGPVAKATELIALTAAVTAGLSSPAALVATSLRGGNG
ncbi:MAG: hypothetical protein M3442_21875 [Chloroflexota bacterium]|nr:hypothetical protein [Chloroflexota bacterium]